ncbi:MAG: metal-dependent transcriptional regulator [Kiritimatiellae bacterium]|nr:metal-dependent transcriptional regulator [Kiritimatiellia bacterium]MBQ3345379.1 metal-dependent transcriptional regulator [Kiritimatiellia bacterium]MBQ6329422.1 metal-dependent transcriptional regulator [Kiritimatiellia bacterium]
MHMATMTQSLEDYLEAIYIRISGGKPAQVRDVARMLSVKMPSVVKAVRELKKMGLVTQEPYSNIELTVKGERVARHVLGRHTLIREFLMKLGVTRKNADRDACLMEHILSAETLDKIRIYTERQ